MNCRKVRRRLVPLLDDELAASEAEVVASHLERCSDCSHYLSKLERSTPSAPMVVISDAELHESQLKIMSALDAEPIPVVAPNATTPLTRLMGGEVRLPRSLVFLYAAALLGAVVWAASHSVGGSPAPELANSGSDEAVRASLELHQPAAYTPSDGWF